MELIVVGPQEFGKTVADLVDAKLRQKPNAVIGFPTGNTPLPVYRELRERFQAHQSFYGELRAIMLDDYLASYNLTTNSFAWLKREIIDPLRISTDRCLRMPTSEIGIEAACAHFEGSLAAWGGCDLLLLGLGVNGHVGFNEPGSSAQSRTRVTALEPSTQSANAGYWHDQFRPEAAVTMGLGTMLESKRVALLARGLDKARILQQAIQGPESELVPASFLRRARNLAVIVDLDAASQLK